MGKQKKSPEELQAEFDAWKATDEFKAIEKFMEERSKLDPKVIDLAAIDLCTDIQEYLNALWGMKYPKKTKTRKYLLISYKYFSLRAAIREDHVLREGH